MRTIIRRAALAATLGLLAAARAEASVLVTVNQVGPDVVASGSGSIDLTGFQFSTTGLQSTGIVPAVAAIVLGPAAGADVDLYLASVTGPSSFGPGGGALASSGSGDVFGFNGQTGTFVAPHGYVSGAHLSATSTYAGQTFASLGLSPGTYTFTLPHDTITVQIAPEPSTLALGVIGAAIGAAYRWRRRRAASLS